MKYKNNFASSILLIIIAFDGYLPVDQIEKPENFARASADQRKRYFQSSGGMGSFLEDKEMKIRFRKGHEVFEKKVLENLSIHEPQALLN